MDPWLLREIDNLQSEINRMGSPYDLSRELSSIREEANRIAGASFMDGPGLPLYMGVDALKQRIDHLKDKIKSRE